jgi:hypothetical protein
MGNRRDNTGKPYEISCRQAFKPSTIKKKLPLCL